MNGEAVLAIEAAVGGGSVAVVTGREVAAKWHGEEKTARSEELLMRISGLLEASGISKESLAKIAVSHGPGSYTGIRIGLATAMGLAHALSIPCVGVSLLKAISRFVEPASGHIVVLPIGRNNYGWLLSTAGGDSIYAGGLDAFADFAAGHSGLEIVAQTDAYTAIESSERLAASDRDIIDFGRDLAIAVGLSGLVSDDGLEPFYARDLSVGSAQEAK